MRSRLCPRCGRPVPYGQRCPGCAARAPSGRSARTREREAARATENPWRASYSSPGYRRARQLVMARQGGLCAVCGLPVASLRDGRWVAGRYGGVHHVVPLSEGGSNDPSNLVLLCARHHNEIDSERRRNG